MPDEKMLMESDSKELVLTTHRVRYEGKKWGHGQITSIMLESLTSCEITHASRPILLVIAAVVGLLLLSKMSEITADVFLGGMVLVGAFVAAYYFTRRQVICLASPSALIRVNTSGMCLDVAKRFIDVAEKAKADRLLSDARSTRVSGE